MNKNPMNKFKASNHLKRLSCSRPATAFGFGRLGFLVVRPWSNPSIYLSQSRLFSVSSSRTLMDVLKAAIRHGSPMGESIAVRVEQKSYSYFQLISSACKISNLLCSLVPQKTFEVDKRQTSVEGVQGTDWLGGARIGIVAKPSAEFVAGMLGTWLCGGVAVPLAFSHPEAELFHVMKDSDVSMLLSTEHHQLMENVAAKCAVKFSLIPPVSLIGESEREKNMSEEIENSKMAEGYLVMVQNFVSYKIHNKVSVAVFFVV